MKFALIGSAGYIAERHMKAIKDSGNDLVCAYDKFDVMGRIDSYFPKAEFFTSLKYFESWLSKNKVDYISICVPNDLHLFFVKLALSYGANVICEKPLALSLSDLNEMKLAENNSKGTVNTILQLRHHPVILKLKNTITRGHTVDLKYITPRGRWYYKSWKGEFNRSGGVLMNIGIHFFDMLTWLFGEVEHSVLFKYEKNKASGKLHLNRATVTWALSLDEEDLPINAQGTYRSLKIDNTEILFTNGFTNLHTISYQNIISGNGYGIEDVMPSIALVEKINNTLK